MDLKTIEKGVYYSNLFFLLYVPCLENSKTTRDYGTHMHVGLPLSATCRRFPLTIDLFGQRTRRSILSNCLEYCINFSRQLRLVFHERRYIGPRRLVLRDVLPSHLHALRHRATIKDRYIRYALNVSRNSLQRWLVTRSVSCDTQRTLRLQY
jgi:hypothetical protein